ncbi:MAG TPA: FGGY-family carbohydrate kinase [Pyrinomonadaceae bacterium]|nr:FGGY-family carbohydrate kinase [Pyrinomonadaceae bacterium]
MEVNNPQAANEYVIGIDVGTGSARAGLFDLGGQMIASAVHPIKIFRPAPNHVEQSSADIWAAVCKCVREALETGRVAAETVAGISFDATCSLAALDQSDQPVTVSQTGKDEQNIIVWMDHRAEKQTAEINRTKHRVLDYVGGKISPEQEIPKLKWIKENLPESWQRTAKFLDLADFLVYRASGKNLRSLCTVVCKWTYLGHEGEGGAWDESFFREIDLADLFINDRVGAKILPMGTFAGNLTAESAAELGLTSATAVGIGIIDAHSGGIGSLGMRVAGEDFAAENIEETLCLIGGTSSCHMAVAPEARFVEGVWGPYFGAMIPGMWLAEGGQSATGALLDHIIENHAYAAQLKKDAAAEGATIYHLLNRKVEELKSGSTEPLTSNVHLLPDFLGNRSPRADSQARGMISGLTLDSTFESLAVLYYATIQAIAYGTRHIIEALNAKGYDIKRIHACGGGTKNPLWIQEHADITRCSVYIAKDCETVLLGAGILAAVAAGKYDSIIEAMRRMSPNAEVIEPDFETTDFHQRKYEVFKKMYAHQLEYKAIMNDASGERSRSSTGAE